MDDSLADDHPRLEIITAIEKDERLSKIDGWGSSGCRLMRNQSTSMGTPNSAKSNPAARRTME
jgi:hypothetical protein